MALKSIERFKLGQSWKATLYALKVQGIREEAVNLLWEEVYVPYTEFHIRIHGKEYYAFAYYMEDRISSVHFSDGSIHCGPLQPVEF